MLSKKKTNYIQIFFLFMSVFMILFFSPYSADDYALLSILVKNENISLKEFLVSAIYFGNGRFLGNLSLWVSVYNDIFRIIVKPLYLTAIIVMTVHLFEIKKTYERIIVALFLMFPSMGFFSKCYLNTPCFFNFVAPFVGFLLSLCILKWYQTKKRGAVSKFFACIVLLVASVCMQLHSEHSTIIFILFAVGICFFERFKYKKTGLFAVLFLVGSLVGAFVMFALPRIMNVATKMEGYRGANLDLPYGVGVLGKFSEMISSAVLLFVLISTAQLIILFKESPQDKYRFIHMLIAAVYPIVAVIYVLNMQTSGAKSISYVKLLFLAMLTLYLINSIVIIVRFVKDTEAKWVILFITLLAAMSVGMFTVLNQHGYRTFYLALFLMFIFTIVMLKTVVKKYNLALNSEAQKVTEVVLKSAFIILVGIMTFQMLQNYDLYIMRDHYVHEKSYSENEVIEIPKLPNERLWLDEYLLLYKEYFVFAGNDKEIKFVDIEDWELYEEYQSMQDNPFTAVTYALSNFNFNKGIRN